MELLALAWELEPQFSDPLSSTTTTTIPVAREGGGMLKIKTPDFSLVATTIVIMEVPITTTLQTTMEALTTTTHQTTMEALTYIIPQTAMLEALTIMLAPAIIILQTTMLAPPTLILHIPQTTSTDVNARSCPLLTITEMSMGNVGVLTPAKAPGATRLDGIVGAQTCRALRSSLTTRGPTRPAVIREGNKQSANTNNHVYLILITPCYGGWRSYIILH